MKSTYEKIGDAGREVANDPLSLIGRLRQSDLGIAIGITIVIIVLITPIPAVLIDYMLALSLVFSVLVLMTSLFIKRALEFSSFPLILLIAAMIRLSLNIATTRLILSEGHTGTKAAGNIIEAFGEFLMQGNPVIGFIIFSILIIVNFIVITKGAGRISEVAARFSLDAMPGKQVAIDADLASGAIDDATAQLKRKELEAETSFYGSMDGASKFVRGDAIAGLMITFINVIGGIIIGVLQKDMNIVQALQNYTLLTIGDGLVSQIPALIISIAAGLIVSKAGIEQTAHKILITQLTNHPKAFAMTSTVMIAIAMMPGMPMLPFIFLAGISGFLAASKSLKNQTKDDSKQKTEAKKNEEQKSAETPMKEVLSLDDIRLEIGYALLEFVNGKQGDLLTKQVKQLRQQFAKNMGFVLPSVRIMDNMIIDKNSYIISIRELEAGKGSIHPDMHMTMSPDGSEIDLPGIRLKDPVFNVPATWIDKKNIEEANNKGYTVVDSISVLTTHLSEIIKNNMAELLNYAQTAKLIENIAENHQKLVSELVPNKISVTAIKCVLQNMLREQVSIRNLPAIFEAIAEVISFSKNPDTITERVREKLAWQISSGNLNNQGVLPLLPISPQWDDIFSKNIIGEGEEKRLSLAPEQLQEFMQTLKNSFENAAKVGEVPVLLTNSFLRPHIRAIVERFRPQTFVMSQNEVHNKIKLKTVGSV